MSRVILVCGRARNSAQVQRITGRGPILRVNDQSASEIRGVGPAERTGKPSVSDCPGGTRSDSSGAGRRPVKPLVSIMLLPMSGCRGCRPGAAVVSHGQRPAGTDEMTGVAVRTPLQVVLVLRLRFPEVARWR